MADKQVAAVAPDGTPITVDRQDVASMREAGGRRMSPLEEARTRREIDLKHKFGEGIGGQIEGALGPALAGAARGLSVGLSDEALLSAAQMLAGNDGREAVRQRLVDYQEYAPTTSTAAELGAIAAASMMGNEASLANAPAAISRLGTAAERVVARGLGEGALARVAGKAAQRSRGASTAPGRRSPKQPFETNN
jgi:hypothetical protein